MRSVKVLIFFFYFNILYMGCDGFGYVIFLRISSWVFRYSGVLVDFFIVF